MANDQELLIRINGTAKNFTDELDKVQKKTKELRKGLATVAKVSAAGFVALTGAVAATTQRFAKFEAGFTNVVTLLDKSSFATKELTKGIDDLKGGVIALGADTGESFETLNKGLFDLVSSGVKADDALDTLTVATNLAAAGATDTATAVKALTATTTAFGKEAGTAQEISEKFFTAQKFGVTTVGELATEFNKVAGISKNLGLGFDEVLASLSALTANGAKPTAQAATELKAAFNGIILSQSRLKNESKAVQDALSLQNIKQRGLTESLDRFRAATGGSVVEMQRVLGSAEALSAVLSLTGEQAELVKTQVAAMGDEQGRAATFAEALATKNATAEKAFRRLTVSIDAIATLIGEQFAPVVNKAATFLAKMAKIIINADPAILKTTATVIAIGAALTGLITTLAVATLGYLKYKAVLAAANITSLRAVAGQKLLNITTAVGTKVLKAFRLGTIATSTAVRALAGATGIGLVLVAISLLIEHFDKLRPLAIATFESLKFLARNAGESIAKTFSGVGDLLIGIFTLDKDKINKSLEDIKDTFSKGLVPVGKEAAKTFTDTFNAEVAAGLDPVAVADQGPELPSAAGGIDRKAAQAAEDARKLELKKIEEQAAAEKAIKEKADADKKATDEKNAADKKAADDLRDAAKLEKQKLEAEKKRLQTIEDAEKDAELAANIDALNEETRAQFNERDIKQFRSLIETKETTEKNAAKNRVLEQIKEHNLFLKNQLEFGTRFAEVNKFFNSQEVETAKNTANLLVGLSRSKNSTLQGIGKAAALVQIGIKTAEGAISAYASLAGIPIVGPALGLAAAASLIAFGGEQAGQVLKAQDGGVVPNGLGGLRDRVPILAEPGELIVPKALAPSFLETAGRPESPIGGEAQDTNVVIGFTEDAVEFIELKIVERQAQGISKLPRLGGI